MSPLDITFVVPSLVRGGAERVTVNLANGLAARGWRPRVLITGSIDALASDLAPEVSAVRLGRPRVRNALTAVVRDLRKHPPAVVMSTHTHVNLALCALRSVLPSSTRMVIRAPIHAPEKLEGRSMRRTRLAQRLLYPRADAIIASSARMATDLSELVRTGIVRTENPVDVARVRGRASRDVGVSEQRARPGRLLVSVGRLSPQKGMDDLITAFARGSKAEDRLEIIGEGAERPRLEQLIRELGLNDRAELMGTREDHWCRVAVADAFVLASHAEGMPNAVLEALALGTPVIASADLSVLEELASEIGPLALRLVPRDRFADALESTGRRTGPFPAPQLLPDRFGIEEAVDDLDRLLRRMVDDEGTERV